MTEREIRQAELESIVKAAMQRVVEAVAKRSPSVMSHFFYGAMEIHPRHLVTWYLFRTDAEWNDAKRGGLVSEIEQQTRAELAAGGYPAEGIDGFHVAFTSDEEIQRETGGDYWAYFK